MYRYVTKQNFFVGCGLFLRKRKEAFFELDAVFHHPDTHQATIRDRMPLTYFRFAPGAQIHCVQPNTKNVGGNKAELRSAESNHTDDGAIQGGQNPALPAALSQQNG
jgi:hypothetical protein